MMSEEDRTTALTKKAEKRGEKDEIIAPDDWVKTQMAAVKTEAGDWLDTPGAMGRAQTRSARPRTAALSPCRSAPNARTASGGTTRSGPPPLHRAEQITCGRPGMPFRAHYGWRHW